MSTLPPNACRLRVKYIKDGRLAYLGHLEVMGTVMRSVRRSGLPFEVGNGFAHRMRIQFSQALPVGASSKGEYFDLLLSEPIDPHAALEVLAQASPPALAPVDATILPRRMPALEAWANLSLWDVLIQQEGIDARTFDVAVEGLRQVGSIDFMRGTKPRHLELGTTLVSWEARDCADGVHVDLRTRSSERGALRPQILVNAAIGMPALRVCRISQWHEEKDGNLIDPMYEESY